MVRILDQLGGRLTLEKSESESLIRVYCCRSISTTRRVFHGVVRVYTCKVKLFAALLEGPLSAVVLAEPSARARSTIGQPPRKCSGYLFNSPMLREATPLDSPTSRTALLGSKNFILTDNSFNPPK